MSEESSGTDTIILIIIGVLVIGAAGFATVNKAQAMASSEHTHIIVLAEDLRMMIDTLVAVPGDAVVEYPPDIIVVGPEYCPGDSITFNVTYHKGDNASIINNSQNKTGNTENIISIPLEKPSDNVIGG